MASKYFYEDFNNTGVDTSGKTGSKQTTIGKEKFQLKPSILDGKFTRRLKANFLDTENLSEVVASKIAFNFANKGSIPEVGIVSHNNNHGVIIASKYIPNVECELSHFNDPKNLNKKRKVNVDHISQDGSVSIENEPRLKQDLADAIAISILVGDHDINPGNMVVYKDDNKENRIARIDLGHSFNDLIKGWKVIGGGKYENNQILDYLNRETITHLQSGDHRTPKLWRFYEGIVPSKEMAKSLSDLSKKLDITEGALSNVKSDINNYINEIIGNKQKEDMFRNSLIALCSNISDKRIKHPNDIHEVFNQSFEILEEHCKKSLKDMKEAAETMHMQLEVDKAIKKGGINTKEIKSKYPNASNQNITWIKTSKKEKAFKGSLDGYIKFRKKSLGLTKEIPWYKKLINNFKKMFSSSDQTNQDSQQHNNEKIVKTKAIPAKHSIDQIKAPIGKFTSRELEKQKHNTREL